MSKERLEEIKKSKQYARLTGSLPKFFREVDEHDFDWLTEQAHLASATITQNTVLAVEFERLQLENNRYRDLLDKLCDTDDIVEVYDIVDEYKGLEESEWAK